MRDGLRKVRPGAVLALGVLALAGQALAGGFYLTLGNPAANPDPKAKNALLVVRPDGCHNPEQATLTAHAEGIVDGKRQTVPLKLVRLSQPATYAVMRDFPAEGAWVVTVVAKHGMFKVTRGALAPVGKNGIDLAAVKRFDNAPPKADIERTLAGLSGSAVRASR